MWTVFFCEREGWVAVVTMKWKETCVYLQDSKYQFEKNMCTVEPAHNVNANTENYFDTLATVYV